ncbi:MAG: acyl-CoA dehydrogenase family protein [Paracoccaceae bacterium]
MASQSVGMAQAALDMALAYAKERRSFRPADLNHQAVGFGWRIWRRNQAARQLVLHAARMKGTWACPA